MEDRTDRYGGDAFEESSGSALLNLFLFSGLMFTVPIGAFFISKQYLDDNYALEPPYNQLVPAVLAIILVNFVIMLYVCRALKIDARERAANKRPIEERKKRNLACKELRGENKQMRIQKTSHIKTN